MNTTRQDSDTMHLPCVRAFDCFDAIATSASTVCANGADQIEIAQTGKRTLANIVIVDGERMSCANARRNAAVCRKR